MVKVWLFVFELLSVVVMVTVKACVCFGFGVGGVQVSKPPLLTFSPAGGVGEAPRAKEVPVLEVT